MSDLRPPEPSAAPAEEPGADTPPPEGTPPPAVPPIDLSEPEVPDLAAPAALHGPDALDGADALGPDALHGPDALDNAEAANDRVPDAPAAAAATEPEAPAGPPLAPAPDGATPTPAPAEAAGTSAGDAATGGPNLKVLVAIMAVVTVALLGAVIYLVTKSDAGTTATTTTTSPTSGTTINTTPVDTTDWVTDTDEASGFTIKRPKDWIVSSKPAGQNRLLLSAGEQNFLLVTARNVNPATVTSEIQTAMSDLDIISGPDNLTIGGLPSVLYIYKTPLTEDNREEGVIIHYFIVRDSKMYSLIFQARPKDELNRLARVFNAVTNSFQSTSTDPAPDPLPTTDTTAAGSTTPTT